MKVSTKLKDKISNFSVRVHNFNKELSKVKDSIDDLNKIVDEGAADIKDAEKFTRRAVAKFNRTKTFCKNFADEAELIAENAEEIISDPEVQSPVEDSVANFAKLGRKMKMIAKRFSDIADNLGNVTTEAESVVNMKPEDVIDATIPEGASEPKSTVNGTAEVPEGAEVTEQPKDVTTPAESVNFSLKNYYNFAIKSITKSFAEVVDNAEDAKDVIEDVSEKVTDEVTTEPEIPAETPENVEVPPTEEAQAEEVKPAEEAPEKVDEVPAEETPTEEVPAEENPDESEEAPADEEFTDDEKAVLEEGKEAIMNENFEASEDLEKKLTDLEAKTEGSGEKVLKSLENFSRVFKSIKNFSASKTTSIYDQIKQFAQEASDAAIAKNVDAADLGAKAENLEKNQPGAGDLLTTVIECFGKIINSIKVPNAPDAPIPAKTFCMKDFCGDIEAFVDNIKVEDKRFCRDVKAKCFALENAIEDDDKDKVKEVTTDLAQELDKSDIAEIKEFGEKLVKFAEEVSAAEAATAEVPAEESKDPSEEIANADSELNKVIDKLDEKGEQLKPEVATFAKKLCSAYKSMKCFTEEDLENKLQAVEGLKKSFDEAPIAEAEKPAEEPAPEAEEVQTSLIEEPVKEPSELPSDGSLLNFSEKIPSAKDDPFGHFAALDIR